jgi:preprotein translocase subunit YajC
MDSRFSGQVAVSQIVAVAAIVIGCVLAVLVFMVIRHQRHRDMAITELRSGCGTRGKA